MTTAGLGSLGALKKQQEEIAERARLRDRPKANWFTPAKTGEVAYIQFLNELDEEAERYNPAFGTYFTAVEHQAPGKDGFKSRALDTQELEGRDWAQEQHLKDPKAGWKPREFFYMNIATADKDGKIAAHIIQRNLSNQFVADLIEEHEESNGVGITGQTYALKRVGEGTSTQWRLKKVDMEMDVSGVEPWDLREHAVRHIPYEKQEEFYMRNADIPQGSPSGPQPGPSSIPAAGSQQDEASFDW